VAAAVLDGGPPHAPLAASVGVATCGPGKERTLEAAEALLREASAALAKAARRRAAD
jgi:hypothetical protein